MTLRTPIYIYIFTPVSTSEISKREPDSVAREDFPTPLSLPHHVVDADEFIVPEKHDDMIVSTCSPLDDEDDDGDDDSTDDRTSTSPSRQFDDDRGG